jgi:hypothetical protein
MDDDSRGTVDRQPSGAAACVTFPRAIGVRGKADEIRGRDNLAEAFLIGLLRGAFRDRTIRESIIKKFPGAYESILARTAFVDSIVEQATAQKRRQDYFFT